MTQHPDLFAALASPFEPGEVKSRSQAGRQLRYVTARTVMNRLDSVLGPENWWDSFSPREHSVTCELTIRLPDGTMLTKSDCGGNAGMADEGDDDKSGFADAFKRAAVKFGVGRYLYGDGVPQFRPGREPGDDPVEPDHRGRSSPPAHRGNGNGEQGRRQAPPAAERTEAPATGRALLARLKDLDEADGSDLFARAVRWAKARGDTQRMVDWDGAMVAAAWSEVCAYREALTRSDSLQSAGY